MESRGEEGGMTVIGASTGHAEVGRPEREGGEGVKRKGENHKYLRSGRRSKLKAILCHAVTQHMQPHHHTFISVGIRRGP